MKEITSEETMTKSAVCVFIVILDGDLVQTPEHLGVSYLMSNLRRHGHQCTLIEVPPGEDDHAVDRVATLTPDFVGISLTTVNFPRASTFGKNLRARLGSAVHICAGGPIATFRGGHLLLMADWSFLDSVVRGEGDNVIGPLVEAVIYERPVHLVAGVTVSHQPESAEAVVATDDLDELPWPARDQLKTRTRKLPYVRISTSRGCTSRCTFCNAPHAGNNLARRKVWRGRSPENVVDEIEFLVSRYGVDTFDFVDSTFEDPGRIGKQRIKRIAELIIERGLHVYYNTCSQAKNWSTEEDRELLALLYKSGLEKTLIGIESGSDRILRLFNKPSTTEDNRRALRMFRDQGVYVAFGFIMFHPLAEWQDIEANAQFLLENMGHSLRRFVVRLELYPGAEVLMQLAGQKLIDPEYWSTLNPYAYRYVNEDVARMAQMINGLFGEDYLLRGSIGKEPSPFAFETLDVTVHTYLIRLLRLHGEDPEARTIIQEHTELIEQERASLTRFNGAIFEEVLTKAKRRHALPVGLPPMVERRYAEAITKMKSIELRLGMRLHRLGISLRSAEKE